MPQDVQPNLSSVWNWHDRHKSKAICLSLMQWVEKTVQRATAPGAAHARIRNLLHSVHFEVAVQADVPFLSCSLLVLIWSLREQDVQPRLSATVWSSVDRRNPPSLLRDVRGRTFPSATLQSAVWQRRRQTCNFRR